MKKRIIMSALVGFTALVTYGCSMESDLEEAERLLSSMNCALPSGMQSTEPFIDLDLYDHKRISLAKKAIEVMRRKDPDQDWDISASQFYLDQVELARAKGNMSNDRDKLTTWIDLKKRNTYPLGQPINEVASRQASFFKESCEQYIYSTDRQHKLFADAEKIQDEYFTSKSDKAHKMPCPVLNEPGCRP